MKDTHSTDETIRALLEVVAFYADPNRDISSDIDDPVTMLDGARAREAIRKYGIVEEQLLPKSLIVDVGNVVISQLGKSHHTTQVTIDGVPQKNLVGVRLDITNAGQFVHLTRAIPPRLQKSPPEISS